jgi:hypothetical protein
MAQELLLSGVYRGKDIYVQNPYTNVEGSFCIAYIEVNGQRVIEEPDLSAVKIDLSRFAINDSVNILIRHHGVCTPKVLNADVLDAANSFSYIQIIADDASISWVTTGELPGRGWYEVYKMKLDGWMPMDTVLAKGNLDNNQYSIGVDHYSGENLFKIIFHYEATSSESEEFSFYSDLDPIAYFPEDKIYDLITLSRPTDYVIKNHEGDILLSGYGQDIIVSSLPYGELIMVLENNEEFIFRPKPEPIDRPKKKDKKRRGTGE